MLGPYIKSRGIRGTEMSANAALITIQTYVQQEETIWKPECKKNVYFGLFRGPWGGLQWSDWAYLAFQLSSHPYLCTCQKRKQSYKKFLCLNPNYDFFFFFIFGGPGGPLCRTQVNENFRAVRPHNRADIRITREKITASFSYTGHNIQKFAFLAIRGALGGPLIIGQGPSCFPAIPSPISIYI